MLEEVESEGLLAAGRPVLVMLSGGRDSTCLLDVAVRIVGRGAVTAFHLNYGLRASADADQTHCEELCRMLGVSLLVEHAKELARPSGNIQAWARDLRYAAAGELIALTGAEIATGHTATDQVETILYRLASSPSRRALLGIRPRAGEIVRPLLRFTREQTATYCAERGLTWRDDESNDSDQYARGRIRNTLVPALRAVHPAAEQNVLAVAEVLRDEADVLDVIVGRELHGRGEIELAKLRELPPAIGRLVVQRLADEAAGGLAPGAARRADEIAALKSPGALDIGSGVRAVVERRIVRFERLRP